MNPPLLPPERVPTLTEVVGWPGGGAPPAAAQQPPPQPAAQPASPPADPKAAGAALATPAWPAGLTESQLSERVLADVQRQIDLMLDYRLREVLTPLLSRMADNLVRETRTELASTLREVVARAVSQELARHRVR